jgi:hypothetical protein
MSPEILPPTEPSTPTEISRRKLLKMLTVAGAGASTAVLLSGQWVKPVAAGGKLAPHAQTSQLVTHTIVSGDAFQNQGQPNRSVQAPAPEPDSLSASCTIAPADPNIPMVVTVRMEEAVPALAPTAMVVIGTKTANTDSAGMASFNFTWDEFDPMPSCNTNELEVEFSFASSADGTGTLMVTSPWVQPC